MDWRERWTVCVECRAPVRRAKGWHRDRRCHRCREVASRAMVRDRRGADWVYWESEARAARDEDLQHLQQVDVPDGDGRGVDGGLSLTPTNAYWRM